MKFWLKSSLYLIIASGVSLGTAGSYDDLFVAIIRDDAGSLTRLLARGVDPNTRDPNGQPALMVAIRRESPRAFELLLAQPTIDPEATNAADETALMLTLIAGDVDASRKLLARGAKTQRPGWSPIHYAASGPSTELTKLLLDGGASVDAESPNGTTALMLAARHAPEATVELLLQRGADPQRRNQRGLQAIDFAEAGGRGYLVERFKKLPR